ncbi:predicted protein [Naegleria gruberi]|uniref:Predicted protein n=1 Tax=Naegleria gruberi TaxID=5762 RepID=D2VKK9_NAEGR|nr:uncharacterized protein NAEGRDRAFT_69430 [Naegleria gruberi]EFC42612.1 predicted protein [Naegleria gruberi]|eukprot:XP_002675356.1 predicted protein [Naegleria gruberi strain NEG-M]
MNQQQQQHFVHAATSSFSNYPSQQQQQSLMRTPSYQYQNIPSSDLNQIPIQHQHYTTQSNNTNNIYSNNSNNIIQPTTNNVFDYNTPPLKSHLHSTGGSNNSSYFQNSQYNNFGQPQQSMHNYHHYGGTTSYKSPTHNNSSGFINQQRPPTDSVTTSYQSPSTAFTPTELSKTKSPSKTPTNSTESNEDSASEEESTNSPNARRAKKSTRACEACRRHHRKCDGGSPCQTCSGKGISCVYTERKKRGPKNEATKLLKKEIEELKEKLMVSERMKCEWEQKCKELAKMAGISITLNDQNMPMFSNLQNDQNSNTMAFSNTQQTTMQSNDQSYPIIFDSSGAVDNSNPLSTIPVFSISLSNEEENNKKRKSVENNLENLKKQKFDTTNSSTEIEHLDLSQKNTDPIPTDGQRFALSTMVTRFINIWDKFVHPFHSLLPPKWQSAMPDLLYDIIRNDGVNSENTFFMYSLLCNSARSLGDIMLSRDLHHKAMTLYPLHMNNPDPRVGFALVLLSYYSMSVGSLRKAIAYCKDALRISEVLDKPQLNLQMNAFLSIASISDDYEERKVNFRRLGQTKQICDVIMSVTGEVQNEITHGGNTNYKELIAQMADLLRLKNMSSSNVTLMHEIAIYGILILCLHKAGYRDLALNYGRKLLEISKDTNFKHCCIGTSSSAIAQAATMFLDFEGYPEFYECMSIMDELSVRYELAGLMKKDVEERFVLMSNHLSSGGSSSGSSHTNSPNMQFL